MKRQRIFLSLGSVLLLLRTYAKEMIIQQKKRPGEYVDEKFTDKLVIIMKNWE